MEQRPVVIVSNRAPVSHRITDDGVVVPTKTGGGLASAMRPLLETGAVWVGAAMSDADRIAAPTMDHDDGVILVDIDPDTYDAAYNRVANSVLWFAHHGLPHPVPSTWDDDWAAFGAYNDQMAAAVAAAAPPDAIVLVQDYHLCLAAPTLRRSRPDLRLVHFSHTPFARPDEFDLPGSAAHDVLHGMAAHHRVGFHSSRWAAAYEATSRHHDVEPTTSFVSPLAPDLSGVRSVAASRACVEQRRELDRRAAGRRVITRVDRIEPSKNILAGFEAFDRLLSTHPDLAAEVLFAAFVYPSRQDLAAYRDLQSDIEAAVDDLNRHHTRGGLAPIHLDTTDNLPGAVAGMQIADVVLVNPLRDGLNLVAMEAPAVNERSCRLVLSIEAGAHDRLADHVHSIDPLDVHGTATALQNALAVGPEAAAVRHRDLLAAIESRTADDWLADQLN